MVSKGLAIKTISEKYKFPFIKDMAKNSVCEREHMKFEKYHVKFCFSFLCLCAYKCSSSILWSCILSVELNRFELLLDV